MPALDPACYMPIVIGATGGSGTRVIARILQSSGVFLGTRLNGSEDALEFGDYSDRWINLYLRSVQHSSETVTCLTEMTQDLRLTTRRHFRDLASLDQPHGWKEPRSIFLLPFFHAQFPEMRFLHVVRDGRDMAFSRNQNQLRKHGASLLGCEGRLETDPANSVAVWSRVNVNAADCGATHLGDQYLRIRFEDVCFDPANTIERILCFLNLTGDPAVLASKHVSPPSSLGRWRRHSPVLQTELTRLASPALERFGYSEQPETRSENWVRKAIRVTRTFVRR